MALLNKNASNSDDEEDLESLRLAALQSLKLKTSNISDSKPTETHCGPQYGYKQSFGSAQTTRNHNRGFRNNSGRPGRNGISSRVRTNTNLISIQTIDDSDTKICNKEVVNDVPKLTLPQDRYCKVVSNTNELKKDEVKSNKFDRYNNSDDSESDVEEIPKETNLERSNSLEQLMSALVNEINGVGNESSGLEETGKDVKEKKIDLGKENEDIEDDTLIILESKPDLELEKIVLDDDESDVEVVKVEEKKPEYSKPIERTRYSVERRAIKSRSKSPLPYLSPRRSRSPSWKQRYPQGHYPRELSPLMLDAEVLNTITMAPLSPRSAAFVLKNREILARRRRSISRGSSRSITPKRSKISPRRRSRSRPLSPRRRTKSRSPKRKSNSPRNQHRTLNYKSNRVLPPRHSRSPPLKLPVHKRLGSRPTSRTNTPQPDERKPETKRRRASRSWSLSLSPSPDRNYIKKPLNESTGHLNTDTKKTRERNRRESPKPRLTSKQEEKPLDPVLEARKRKFESGQIETNGIIKLKLPTKQSNEETEHKSKTPDSEEKTDNIEDELDVIELNPSIDDLWSDEESNSENEGRFKSKPTSRRTITTLPFTKLLNKPNPGNIQLPKTDTQHNHRKARKSRNHTRRRTSRSPIRKSEKLSKPLETTCAFKQVNNKLEETKKCIVDKEETKKIKLMEVDDQNTENIKVSNSEKDLPRRVRIANIPEPVKPSKIEEKPEINEELSIHNDDDLAVVKSDDGDLRAELSRRRAERLKAGCLSEAVPTRLLRNALEDAVPKRLSSTKQIKGNGSSADRRVLVLKRLVASSASDLDPANKAVSASDGKLPIHMRLGLSSGSELTTDENVRIERRMKRSRSGRRRKGSAVQV